MSNDSMPSDSALPEGYPDLLEELAAKIAAFLVDQSFDPALSSEAGRVCAEHVRRDWGGQRIYIPMGKAYEVSQRDRAIVARWNGRNTRELCREYGISETHLRRIAAPPTARKSRR